MYELNAGRFLVALTGLSNFSAAHQHQNFAAIRHENLEDLKRQINFVVQQIQEIGLSLSLISASALQKLVHEETSSLPPELYDWAKNYGQSPSDLTYFAPFTLARLHYLINELINRVKDELQSYVTLCFDHKETEILRIAGTHFGQLVLEKFPTASYDVDEAAKCLAFNRGTACVMHLMRACEVMLRVLAHELGVKDRNNWGSYLNEISHELDKRAARLQSKTVNEVFYAEAAANLNRVKRAWRNPSMHVDRKYSSAEAENIFGSVKALAEHLATQLSE
jgi:hypothetical protein